jgi:hypothetical protein
MGARAAARTRQHTHTHRQPHTEQLAMHGPAGKGQDNAVQRSAVE